MKAGMVMELAIVAAAIGLGIFAIVRARAEGRPILDLLGVRWNGLAAPDLLAGVAITAGAMAGIFFIEIALGGIGWSIRAGGAGQAGRHRQGRIHMRSLLLSGLLLVVRGRAPLAVGISAVAFGLIHFSNPGASALSVLGNALGGAIYGIAFLMARSLWLPIGLHFAWNFTQGPLLGFPVSGIDAGGLQHIVDAGPAWLTGGACGPEAGAVGIAFRFVVIALVVAWVRMSRRASRVDAPSGVVQTSA